MKWLQGRYRRIFFNGCSQLEAVSYQIREELQTDETRKEELLREWTNERDRSSHWTLVLMCCLLIGWFALCTYH